MSEPEPRRYAFDDFCVDALTRQLLRRDGEVIALTPKVFDTLLQLVQHAGKTVGKDELMTAVWPGRVVEENNLNQNISVLRRVLGTGAGGHRYIVTEPGRGFRFVADVRIDENDTSMKSVGLPESSPAPEEKNPRRFGEAASQPRATEEKSGGARLAVIGAAVALVFAITAGWIMHARTPSAVAAPTLVVLPLRTLDEATSENALAEGLSEELITRLAHIEGLRLISRTSAARAQQDKFDLAQLGERLHVTHALEGSLRQSGDQLRIDLRLVEIPGGRTLWSQEFDRKLADVFAIQREIAQSVAQVLTLKLGAANAAVEADVDPQWFQEYLELRHRMGDVKYFTARKEFVERAQALVTHAPGYARAHGLLASALVPALRPVEISADERAEAAKEAALALKLDPNQIEAHAALAVLASLAEDWPRCLDEYRLVLKLDPSGSAMRAAYAARLAGIGYIDEGLQQIDIAWNADPLNFESITLRGWLTDVKGRHEEARPLLEMAPSELNLNRQWFNAVWRRDFAAARDLAARMPAQDKFTDSYVAASEALLDPLRWPDVQSRVAVSLASVV
ncbi:winged helix-turn-helix domain-containing protein [Rudaea sp.]|uniref:winged helix-turn-helix domain-containing protein n=1 Tax=Rudaea sp. TaxID=2136325 RepID=UPI002ECFCD4A